LYVGKQLNSGDEDETQSCYKMVLLIAVYS